MAHPLSVSSVCVVVPLVGGFCFCVVVPGHSGLTKLSHECPVGQPWEALAASESCGTPKAQTNNQPARRQQCTHSGEQRQRGT